MKKFSLIVAMDTESTIGIKEYGEYTLPWPRLKADMLHFKKLTTRTEKVDQFNIVIVGNNTWQTLPLVYKRNKQRLNIVLSTKSSNSMDTSFGEVYINGFANALDYCRSVRNIHRIFVIGGSQVYRTALADPSLERIYLTYIANHYPKENIIEEKIFFPLGPRDFYSFKSRQFITERKVKYAYDKTSHIAFTFKVYTVNEGFHEAYVAMATNPERNISPKILEQPTSDSISDGEYQYLNLVRRIITEGVTKSTRNQVTKSIFGHQLMYELSEGYPIYTVKRSYPKAIFEELMWMIRGSTNVNDLRIRGVHIWDANSTSEFIKAQGLSYDEGDIGPGYGFQLRHYGATYIDCKTDYTNQGFDQLAECVRLIRTDPSSRRILINLWNPTDTKRMVLPPCHLIYNFTVDLYDKFSEKIDRLGRIGRLNCHLFQRSWDVFLGWNTTTAALFTYILAAHCNLDPGKLVHSITDAHLYQSHIESGAVEKLLARTPRRMATLTITTTKSRIEDYEYDDLVLKNYYPAPAIVAEMVA